VGTLGVPKSIPAGGWLALYSTQSRALFSDRSSRRICDVMRGCHRCWSVNGGEVDPHCSQPSFKRSVRRSLHSFVRHIRPPRTVITRSPWASFGATSPRSTAARSAQTSSRPIGRKWCSAVAASGESSGGIASGTGDATQLPPTSSFRVHTRQAA